MNKAILILIGFYRARTDEMNSKAGISYFLWAAFIIMTIVMYMLHYQNAINNTSVYMAFYPIFLLAWLSCIVYVDYKIKLLWVHLEQIERYLFALLFTDSSQKTNSPVPVGSLSFPLWAVGHSINLKKIGWMVEWLRPVVKWAVGALATLLLYVFWLKGFSYIRYNSTYMYAAESATAYTMIVWIAYVLVIWVNVSLARRVTRAKSEDLLGPWQIDERLLQKLSGAYNSEEVEPGS